MPTMTRELVTPTAYVVSPPELQEQDPAAWLKERENGLGASDVIKVIGGLDKYDAPLKVWLQKRGEPVDEERDEALEEAAEAGHLMEPVIAEMFHRRTGFEVLPNMGTLAHVDRPWMRASLDRVIYNPHVPDPMANLGALELKNRSHHQLEDWLSHVPAGPRLQIQWQLGVTGYRWGYVAALIGGNKLVYHRVDRDDELIDQLIVIGEEFWGWVQDGIEPPADASESLSKVLNARWKQSDEAETLILDPAVAKLWKTQRARGKALIKEGEALVTEAENHMKTITGANEVVYAGGQKAWSWRWYPDTRVDSKALRAAGLYDEFSRTKDIRRLYVTADKD